MANISDMSDSTLQNLRLDEFLVVINDRDLEGAYIIPKPDVAVRLTKEIEARTGIKSCNLAGEENVKEFKQWVSAQPGRFIVEAHLAVDAVGLFLKRNEATSFEMIFHNLRDEQNWGDRVLLAIRYEGAANDA